MTNEEEVQLIFEESEPNIIHATWYYKHDLSPAMLQVYRAVNEVLLSYNRTKGELN